VTEDTDITKIILYVHSTFSRIIRFSLFLLLSAWSY